MTLKEHGVPGHRSCCRVAGEHPAEQVTLRNTASPGIVHAAGSQGNLRLNRGFFLLSSGRFLPAGDRCIMTPVPPSAGISSWQTLPSGRCFLQSLLTAGKSSPSDIRSPALPDPPKSTIPRGGKRSFRGNRAAADTCSPRADAPLDGLGRQELPEDEPAPSALAFFTQNSEEPEKRCGRKTGKRVQR